MFRELAADYMRWLATDRGAKPTTLRDHAYKLAEPGTAHNRGSGVARRTIMRELGDLPAAEIITDEVRGLLWQRRRQMVCLPGMSTNTATSSPRSSTTVLGALRADSSSARIQPPY